MVINKFFPIFLYTEASGKVPVNEWLKDFEKNERKAIDRDIKCVQYTWPWKMPLIKSLGGGLMEIRSKLQNRQIRIMFILHEGAIVLLHGFVKKTQKIPNHEIDIARKRAGRIKQRKTQHDQK